ncbi:hypothetical protein JTE90_018175 [Oedothorax gibbosus]|uniref:Uncharacterized protein n=1 Tax=Oedothorax gibbosus TaxID=931172 RepID=A0AAV6U8I0_9ARAC|nr:hypothetical protein JTE90_018175 [Oedothorax gibbosus]
MLPTVPSKSKELVAKLVCSTEQEKCMLGNWVVCKDKYEALTSDVQNGSELISWYAWDSNSERRTVKTVKEGTLDDAINTLEEQIPSFLEHCFIKQSQSEYFQDSKKNVSEKKCLLQVDFCENFTIMQQDEVQSAHWTNDQVSIYTAVAHTITEKVTVMYVDDEEVKSQVAKLEKRWDNISALPKTHETHCVRTEGVNTVRYSMTSKTDGKVFHSKN